MNDIRYGLMFAGNEDFDRIIERISEVLFSAHYADEKYLISMGDVDFYTLFLIEAENDETSQHIYDDLFATGLFYEYNTEDTGNKSVNEKRKNVWNEFMAMKEMGQTIFLSTMSDEDLGDFLNR